LNILFLSELFYPHGGGAELATYLYAKLLAEAKFNVVVVTNRFSGEPEFSPGEGFVVYRLPLLKKKESVKFSVLLRFDVLVSGFMRKWIKWADVVYVPRFWFSAIPIIKACGKLVMVHIHDYIPVCPLAIFYDSTRYEVCQRGTCSMSCILSFERRKRNSLMAEWSSLLNFVVWPFLTELVDYSDAVVCVSEAQRALFTKRRPKLTDKTYVIFNPLPEVPFMRINGKDFGYFGGPNVIKGFPVLIKALSLLKKSATIQATRFDDQLSGKIRSFGNAQIIFHERLSRAALNELHKSISAVIVPSVWPEPWGYVLTEALLRGQIVLASRIGGIPEQVEGCEGAFLFEAGDYRELARLIDYISGLNMEALIELGSKNRESLLRRFRSEKVSNSIIELINRITN